MDEQTKDEITRLLVNLPPEGVQEVIRLAYQRLRKIAQSEMNARFSGQGGLTLQATAIVHEVLPKLMKVISDGTVTSGDHFFGVATYVIRWFVLDYARHRTTAKGGGGERGVSLEAAGGVAAKPTDVGPEYRELLERYYAIEPRKCEAFVLRQMGFTSEETAALLGVSVATVERDVADARAWFKGQLK